MFREKICLLMPKISSWDEQWSLTGCFRLFLIWMLPPTKGTLILSQSLASQTPCVTWMDFFGGLSYDELPTIIRWICRVWLSFWRKETVDDGVMGILHDSLESIRNHTFEMMYTRPVSLSLFSMASFTCLANILPSQTLKDLSKVCFSRNSSIHILLNTLLYLFLLHRTLN